VRRVGAWSRARPLIPTAPGWRTRLAWPPRAVGTTYQGHSHFEGQEALESGLPGFGSANSGWLNRGICELSAISFCRPVVGLAVDSARRNALTSRQPSSFSKRVVRLLSQ